MMSSPEATLLRQQLEGSDFWERLEQYRSTQSADTAHDRRLEATRGLLQDVDFRLLLIAVSYAVEMSDEPKRKAIQSVLASVFRSPFGPEAIQNNVDVTPLFLAGLYHQIDAVRVITIDMLVILATDESGNARRDMACLILTPPLLPALVAVAGSGDTASAQDAGNALITMCSFYNESPQEERKAARRGVIAALKAQIRDAVEGMSQREATVPKLRYASVLARLVARSEESFRDAEDEDALPMIMDLAKNFSDPLVQINALELVRKVASTGAGTQYLLQSGFLSLLLGTAGGDSDDCAPDPLIGVSALEVLATVLVEGSLHGDELWRDVSSMLLEGFLRACRRNIEAAGEGEKLSALVAASTVAERSNDALKTMLSENTRGTESLLEVWLTLSRHKVEVKAAALHAVARALRAPSLRAINHAEDRALTEVGAGGAVDEDRKSLAQDLFDRIGQYNNQATGAMLLGMVRQPVPEIRYGAYNVLRCTAWQPGAWGLRALFSQPGFREVLEDRGTEVSKAGKEWKFSVVEAIMQCKERGILGGDILDSLHKFLKEGPFYVPAKAREAATLS